MKRLLLGSLLPLFLLACGGDSPEQDPTVTAETVARVPTASPDQLACERRPEKDGNCFWDKETQSCPCAINGHTPTPLACGTPPDDWPVLELSVDDFHGFGPLIHEGRYNLGGYRLEVPRGMWVERGIGPYPVCVDDPCPVETTEIYLSDGDRPPNPSRWILMEWYRGDEPTTWQRFPDTEVDCSCPVAVLATIACYLEGLK